MLALGSSIIWGFFWILNMKVQKDELVKLFINFAFGFIMIAITTLIFGKIQVLSLNGLLGVCYIGSFEMGITFIFWLMALKYSKTTAQVSSLIYLSPFLSLFIINLVLGEKILFSTLIGLCLIIIGIVIQSVKSKNLKSGSKILFSKIYSGNSAEVIYLST